MINIYQFYGYTFTTSPFTADIGFLSLAYPSLFPASYPSFAGQRLP